MTPDDPLTDELRALSRSISTPPVDDGLVAAVLDRVAGEPIGRPSLADRLRARWRAIVAALLVLLGGLALAPPVRATVADWFGFGGVVVRQGSGSGPSTAPPPPAATGLSVEEAARLAGFTPLVPAALGAPDGAEVSADRRVVSMSWGTAAGTVRLDEIKGDLSPAYLKSVYDRIKLTRVGAATAYWFPEPHDLVVIDAQGVEHTEAARHAGPTQVWVYEAQTQRLEGELTEQRAVEIAETAVRR
jgi:hypothetical protein